jgi:Domain of unknown function (DUF2760)
MQRILNAFWIFFLALFNREAARQVDELLKQRRAAAAGPPPLPQKPAEPKPVRPMPAPPKKPARSDAITLLAALQREGRLIDFFQESLADYSDAQIGAAARDVHRQCAAVLDRLFGLEPVVVEEEGAEIDVPAGYDVGRFHLTGNVTGQPPFRGRLMHHGWRASRCELPTWSGKQDAALVVAPAEVELPG